MLELTIANLANLEPGRIFYSGKLYIIESAGAVSKARPWGTQPGTMQDCVTLSPKCTLARFYPVIERAIVLPVLDRSDFLVRQSPTAYTFKSENDAGRAAQLDCDLAVRCGLGVQRIYRVATWVLTDGAKAHRLYHYHVTSALDSAFNVYCAEQNLVQCAWPDERTPHYKLLFG